MDEINLLLQIARENAEHIAILNDETGEIEIQMAALAADMEWVKKFLWVVVAAALGGMVTSIYQMVRKK